MLKFKDFALNEKILAALDKKGYVTPTPIQEKSIPHLLEGKDLLGIAQTGTGKTAAFSLPILNNLAASNKKVSATSVRCLILTPTRELAAQIVDNIKLYGEKLGLRYNMIFGGVSIIGQVNSMKTGADIVVATPGRLLDLINRRSIKFDDLEIFVLDEADRMLDMGFINDVRRIISKLPKKRQSLFFSATMPKDIAQLASSILNNPVSVEITPQATTVEKIDQQINFVDKANKPLLLKEILRKKEVTSALVFSKTKFGANRIVTFLQEDGVKVEAIHGNKSQVARQKALNNFRQGKTNVLVATDIAARGIDVPDISHVINYDIPHDPENYVHRIGRTARAGKNGIAISLCDASEKSLVKSIEKTIKYTIPVDTSHTFHNAKPSITAKKMAYNEKQEFFDKKPASRKPTAAKSGAKGGDSYFSQSRRRKDDVDDKQRKVRMERVGRFEDDSTFKKKKFGDKGGFFKGDRDERPTGSSKFGDKKPVFGNKFKKDERDGARKPAGKKFGFFGKKKSDDRDPSFGFNFDSGKDSGDSRDKKRSFGAKSGSSFGAKPKFGGAKKPFGGAAKSGGGAKKSFGSGFISKFKSKKK
jgi:ATP-dependent RNA helicase RhlE